MVNISELTGLPAMAAYYERKLMTLPPYAGETYFPAIKIPTDMLSYFDQKQGAPVLAKASNYDSPATPINRDGATKSLFGTGFFRSAAALNEQDLEEINRALAFNDDSLFQTLIFSLFDDKTKLLLGMRSRREWLAFQALMNGEINLKSNGTGGDVTYTSDPDFQAVAKNDWSDTENSDPFDDLQKAIKAMKRKGITPNQIIMNDETFGYITHNVKVQSSLFPGNMNASNMIISENVVVDLIKSELHVIPVVYDQGFVDVEATGTENFTPFVPDGKVVLLNGPVPEAFAKTGTSAGGVLQSQQLVGHMAFAPTPEELGMRNGRIASNTVQIFDTGVAYHEYYNDNLVQTEDLVSMNVLPSFEGSRSVFRLTVAKPATGNAATGDGESPKA